MQIEHCDVFIIGGGPAGTTAGTLLAERGHRVALAEKERHPRFHIGESLLPLNMPLFDRLGVREQIDRIGMPKWGAEFNSPRHDHTSTVNFSDAMDKNFPLAYQVKRDEFDEILFKRCEAAGVHAMQETKVAAVELLGREGARVTTESKGGVKRQWQARFLVDASGRDTFLANRLGIKEKNRKHNSAAIFGHFTGAKRLDGREEGNISLFWFEHGWFWFIPLHNGVTSIGAVCWPYYLKTRKTNVSTFLLDTIALCPALMARMKDAKMIEPARAAGNYAYECTRMMDDGYLLLGDAYAFVDPVLSSGVLLAMNSAFVGADVIDAWLKDPVAARPLLKRMDRDVRRGLKEFKWFIYRMTSPAIREMFMRPGNNFRMKEAVLSLLAGDLFRGTPTRASLTAFKVVYYFLSLVMFKRCFSAWRQRRRSLRESAQAA